MASKPRPKYPPELFIARPAIICIKVTKEEKAQIKKNAESEELNVSAFARRRLLKKEA